MRRQVWGVAAIALSVLLFNSQAWASGVKPSSQDELQLTVEKALAQQITIKDILWLVYDSGKEVSDAVRILIKAGIDPANVINVAITEGFHTKLIVKAAVEGGADLKVVAKAVHGTGAAAAEAIQGMIDAGVPADIAANVVAEAEGESAPVFGFSPVEDKTPPVDKNLASIRGFGAGGGGSPSTKKASETTP